MPGIIGAFGHDEVKLWLIMIGLDEKGGMDYGEFQKYILISIAPLFPDAADVDGKRVIVKLDSGPGRMNIALLAQMRLLGFVLYPIVPNTIEVTQETDINYGLFKSVFHSNLDAFTLSCTCHDLPVSLAPWIVGLVVFGGIDPLSDECIREDAFFKGLLSPEESVCMEESGCSSSHHGMPLL